jgi:cation transport ATPase
VKDLILIRDNFRVQEAMGDKDLLFFLTYLAEKGSEHPLAKAIVSKIEQLIPSKIEEYKNIYTTKEFKNRDGEGVQTIIINKETNEEMEILCGNDKITKHFNIDMITVSYNHNAYINICRVK